jgi:hypothetical protein
MKKIIFTATVFALIASSFSHAGPIKTVGEVVSNNNCLNTSIQITTIKAVAPIGEDIVPDNTALNSTSCLGFMSSPDNTFADHASPNMGGLGDGLLNGEIGGGSGQDAFDDYYVPGDTFLTNDSDSMVNLDGIGEDNDPGWIRLGGADADDRVGDDWKFEYDSIGGFNLSSVITMSFSDAGLVDGIGSWSLAVDPSAIAAATLALGRPSVFDHLAFVMKGPNNEDDSWAIYDFNFHDLIDDGLDISLGDTAYTFEGTWDKNLFNNPDALSHMSVWAHDPPATLEVPEPSTLAIFALGVIGLVSRRFNKHP